MASDYRTVKAKGISEVTAKKSRFLGEAVRVGTPEEAGEYIAAVRKRYYDARHHCFAFIAGEPGTPDEILRSSDDGEPSGTAGKPMLELLSGRKLHHTLVIVTRYFGGTLLGTGGLVRAYSGAAAAAVENAGIVCVRRGVRLRIRAEYADLGRIGYRLARDGVTVEKIEYADRPVITALVPESQEAAVKKAVTDLTGGTAVTGNCGPAFYEEEIGS